MGRIEYLNDPNAPKPNTLVPACGTPAANDEASDAAWVHPARLGELDIHPTTRQQIDDYLANRVPHVD